MKLEKYTFIFAVLLVMNGVSGCDEAHLNLSPPTEISEENFYNTMEELELAVNGVYGVLGEIYDSARLPENYGELLSDNTGILSAGGGAPHLAIANYIILNDNVRIQNIWDHTYQEIYKLNHIIHHVENTELDVNPVLQSRWLSEAKTVRSLAYFNLVAAFGDVPLVLTPILPQEAYDYMRENSETIYQQIISDLTAAKENLPASYSGNEIGRITRYGAAAVLAKIHMFRRDNSAAQPELEFIIDSGQYSLDGNNDGTVDANDFFHNFLHDTKNNRESVLEAQYMAGPNAFNSYHPKANMPRDWTSNYFGMGGTGGGDGYNTPTRDLGDEFEDGDPRKEISFVPGFLDANGNFIDYPYTLKFFEPFDWHQAGSNFTIIRYADILLMYAEVTGNPEYLNMVRERVGLPPFGSEEYPSDLYPTFELAIEHERRMELAGEFHRMFDLVRTGRAVEVLQGKGLGFQEHHILFPIPQHARDVHPGLTQNPGY